MRIKFLKLKNWLLVTVMGALGFSACHSAKEMAEPQNDDGGTAGETVRPRDEMRLMYGVPTMNFRVSGRVVTTEGKPMGEARVTMLENGIEVDADTLVGDPGRVKQYLDEHSVITNKKGQFEVQESGTPRQEVKLFVRRRADQKTGKVVELKVDEASVDRTNAGGWNTGTFNKEVEIQLEQK